MMRDGERGRRFGGGVSETRYAAVGEKETERGRARRASHCDALPHAQREKAQVTREVRAERGGGEEGRERERARERKRESTRRGTERGETSERV
jgi:hypothetical protein